MSEKNEIIKITKESFLRRFEPLSMVTEYRHIKNTIEAIKSDKNSISVYSKHLGEDAVLVIIELHLVALNNSLNLKMKLNKMQIKEIAIEIITLYFYFSVVEIQYIFRKAKRGDFGKFYQAIDIVEILSWFSQYAEERAQHFIEENTKDIQNDHSMRSADRKLWQQHEKLINKNNQL